MGPTAPEAGCRAGLTRLAWFAASVAVLSAAAGGFLGRWIDLPWWKIFRRCASVSALLTLWFFMRHLHHQPIRTLGLDAWKGGRRQVTQGVLIGCSVVALIGAWFLLAGWCRIAIHADSMRLWRTRKPPMRGRTGSTSDSGRPVLSV